MSDRFNDGGHNRGSDNRDSGGYRGSGGGYNNNRGGGMNNNMHRQHNYQNNQRGPPEDQRGGQNMNRQMSNQMPTRQAIGQPVNVNTSLDGFYTSLMREEMP